MMAQQTAESSAQAAANQKAGDAYLAENAKKEGVKTTASGLQYKVIKSGTGKTPKSTDTVAVNYRGSLISGKEFDASRDEPATFPVTGVIPGWTEVLQLMKEGDKWQVTIPAKLAYGANGTPGGPIGPNEVLVFDVELVSIKPAK
jgi:FKBP-type peptidyl-prolyl cis-trans isomerase